MQITGLHVLERENKFLVLEPKETAAELRNEKENSNNHPLCKKTARKYARRVTMSRKK
jgi:hypothetical protein